MYELPKQKGAMQVGLMSMGTIKQQGGGGGAGKIFVQNQSKSLWSMDFEGRERAGLNFVQLDQMLKMCIPFLPFTLTWQEFRPKLVIMAKRDTKFGIIVVNAQNTQKTHILHAPSGNVETATKKHMYKNDTAKM